MQNFKDYHLSNVSGTMTPIQGASVLVTLNGVNATLYSDNGVTAQANPMTTDVNGQYSFYAADGRYLVTITKAGYNTATRDVILDDPANANAIKVNTAVAADDAVPLAQKQARKESIRIATTLAEVAAVVW